MFEWTFQTGRESIDDYDYMSDSDLEDAEDSGAVQDHTVLPVKGKDRATGTGTGGSASGPELVNGDTSDEKDTRTGGPLQARGFCTTF